MNTSMQELIERFPDQLEEAIELGSGVTLKPCSDDIHHVVVTGLGGSGIGGKLVADLLHKRLNVPLWINNDYDLPAFVDEHTLVIANSYSGNTEETLSAAEEAMKRRAQIVCITSGGRLAEQAEINSLPIYKIPAGNPPRAMLAYSSTMIFYTLQQFGLIDDFFRAELSAAAALIRSSREEIKARAIELAEDLQGTIPVIYSPSQQEAVAIRWRQQLNENSKVLCWHHVVPEMNHNELVGWSGGSNRFSVIALITEPMHPRVKLRMEFSLREMRELTDNIFRLEARGESPLQQAYFLIHLGDWVSEYLAQVKEVDSMDIAIIDKLKSELAQR